MKTGRNPRETSIRNNKKMDYKYIDQLLERYWVAETTLEEEEILRAFFSQTDIPAELEPLRPLFAYEQVEKQQDRLGSDFDERILAMIEEEGEKKVVKARTITLSQRLMPFFRAAAVVAIILTLGQAAQVPFQQKDDQMQMAGTEQQTDGVSVAINGDTARIDTMQQSKAYPQRSTTDASLNEADVFEVNGPNDNRQ